MPNDPTPAMLAKVADWLDGRSELDEGTDAQWAMQYVAKVLREEAWGRNGWLPPVSEVKDERPE